jgi:KUP system potassium uptake protein
MSAHRAKSRQHGSPVPVLALSALGVVYGDIGTSPLYSLRECFLGEHGMPVTPANVYGVLSLVFWALIIVVTVKYHVYVLRADNDGEGGILALMALVRKGWPSGRRMPWLLVSLGLFGAALLYGDGIITPAISVLSAVEGLEVETQVFHPYVVPLTVVVLVALFAIQRRGTGGIGKVFGPVMLVWFGTLAVLGVKGIFLHPAVLAALNPIYGVHFFAANGGHGFLVLGAVFLVATGGEALYADMGHFGELPIQIDWFSLVFPSLLLNYLGQGALLIVHPEAARNPFYLLAPSWALLPLVALATAATVIASQAIISGSFSLTRQAVQLGYSPRMNIIHTSSGEIGQIYIPSVNWALMAATIWLVLAFRSSGSLAAAYGIAVTLTMIITTLLAYFVTRHTWRWSLPAALAATGAFLVVDLAFLGANLAKIAQGGWVPLVVGGLVFILMSTWSWGRRLVTEKLRSAGLPLDLFLGDVALRGLLRVEGTAVFLTADPENTSTALLHNVKHNKVLHRQNVLLTVRSEEAPYVDPEARETAEELGDGFYRLVVRYGFMEEPNVPLALRKMGELGVDLDPMKVTYFLNLNALNVRDRWNPRKWRERVFAVMARNAQRVTAFYRLPTNRVVELGLLIEI